MTAYCPTCNDYLLQIRRAEVDGDYQAAANVRELLDDHRRASCPEFTRAEGATVVTADTVRWPGGRTWTVSRG